MNDQTAANAPIQYPSSSYLTMNNNNLMTNPLANVPYIDPFYQPEQQQQQQYYPSLQFPSVISKQDHGLVSSAMENSDLIYYPDFQYDPHEYFPPGYNNFDQNARYWFIDLKVIYPHLSLYPLIFVIYLIEDLWILLTRIALPFCDLRFGQVFLLLWSTLWF